MVTKYDLFDGECHAQKGHGDYVKDEDYEALEADRDAQQKRADALAAENAAMRNALESIRIYSSDTLSGPSDSVPDMAAWLRDGIEHLHQVSTIQTPATDAALAAIEARGVEKYAELFKETVNMERKHNQEFYNGTLWFAKQMREAK